MTLVMHYPVSSNQSPLFSRFEIVSVFPWDPFCSTTSVFLNTNAYANDSKFGFLVKFCPFSPSSWCWGLAAACACGSRWTFLLLTCLLIIDICLSHFEFHLANLIYIRRIIVIVFGFTFVIWLIDSSKDSRFHFSCLYIYETWLRLKLHFLATFS